jgi:hypothetical protein
MTQSTVRWQTAARAMGLVLVLSVIAMGGYLVVVNVRMQTELNDTRVALELAEERADALYEQIVSQDRVCPPSATPSRVWVLVADEPEGPQRWQQFAGCAVDERGR